MERDLSPAAEAMRPAVWNSAESSARRSHSRRGAIPASSLRTSSESARPSESTILRIAAPASSDHRSRRTSRCTTTHLVRPSERRSSAARGDARRAAGHPVDHRRRRGPNGETFEAVEPHDTSSVLAEVHKGGEPEVDQAIKAAGEAWEDWRRWPWEDRAAVFLRAAELLSGPWRATLTAATMLDQSKTAHQAEIDAACELIDFWRYNVELCCGSTRSSHLLPRRLEPHGVPPPRRVRLRGDAVQLHGDRRQPPRPSAALMGNTVVWKPASTCRGLRLLG